MNSEMEKDILKVLVTEEELKTRVAELGDALYKKYEGRRPLFLGVLKGSFIFMAPGKGGGGRSGGLRGAGRIRGGLRPGLRSAVPKPALYRRTEARGLRTRLSVRCLRRPPPGMP